MRRVKKRNQIAYQVREQVMHQMWELVRKKTLAHVYDAARERVWVQVQGPVWTGTNASMRQQTREEVMEMLYAPRKET
jgi:hypothetical protein